MEVVVDAHAWLDLVLKLEIYIATQTWQVIGSLVDFQDIYNVVVVYPHKLI
jgi:hypothetical protein